MASTFFTDFNSANPIVSAWLNDVNNYVYNRAVDTGSVNAALVVLTPAPSSIPDGFRLRWRAGFNNTGPMTLQIQGFGAYALQSSNGTFQGGEHVIGDEYDAAFSSVANAWLLMEQSGGNIQVPLAVQSGHAVQYSQLTGFVAGTANIGVGAVTTTNLATGAATLAKLDTTGGVNTILMGQGVGVAPAWVASGVSTQYPQVRQTVAYAAVSSATGAPSFITNGSGLQPLLQATAVPVHVNYAAGPTDFSETISLDTSFPALVANTYNFLSVTRPSAGVNTLGSTLAPPQYGYSYNSSAQALLHFNGSAGSTAIIDDYGNTWTAQGGAKLQTNQLKLGSAALGGGGANNALNGTTDWVYTQSITTLGGASKGWTLGGYFYMTSLATTQCPFSAEITGGYGLVAAVTTSGKFTISLSSSGTAWDILSSTPGVATLSINTWYYLELTYDPVAQSYYAYVNGALDQTKASALSVCPVSQLSVGYVEYGGAAYFTGYVDEFQYLPYCLHPAGTAYTAPSTAATVSTVGYSSDWFNTSLMQMFTPSSPSLSAGTPPTFTTLNRVYVGEAAAGASTISSSLAYALNGKYDSGLFPVVAATAYTKSHNMGCTSYNLDITMADDLSGTNERPTIITWLSGTTGGWSGAQSSRNSSSINTATNVGFTSNASGGFVTSSNYRIRARRAF